MPRGEAVLHALAGALHSEVDDRRRASVCGRAGARLERVGRERAAERELHVGVDVDTTRDDVLPGRVDDPLDARPEVGAQRSVTRGKQRDDALAIDEDVHELRAHGAHDGAAPHQDRHGRTRSP